jgi:hypothetical protein
MPTHAQKTQSNQNRMRLMHSWLLVLVLCITLFGCQAAKKTTIPQDMDNIWGMWRASAEQYADRFLDITRGSLILGTGEGRVALHPIRRIEKTYENGDILYTIIYLNEQEQAYKLSFYYLPDNGGLIWFKHQKQIEWRRKES